MFFVYLLKCSDGTYYCGKTNDLKNRLRQHNGQIKGGAKYTSGRTPVTLVYKEGHQTITDALKREIEIKKLTRREKILLIKTIQK